MTVTLQLSHQHDVLSDIIAHGTRSWCSHVDIVWPDGRLFGARSDVCKGVPAGVQFRPADYAIFDRTERISFVHPTQMSGVGESDFYDFLMEQEGKPYDRVSVVGLALSRDWRNPNKWFCSELAMAALEAGGFVRPISSPVAFISPRDILMLGEAFGLAA